MTQSLLFDADHEVKPDLPGWPCAWSPCRAYRYTLWRVWANQAQPRYAKERCIMFDTTLNGCTINGRRGSSHLPAALTTPAYKEANVSDSQRTHALPPFPVIEGARFAHVPAFHGYAASSDGQLWTCFQSAGRTHGKQIGSKWRRKSAHRHKKTGYVNACLYRDGKGFTRGVHTCVLESFFGPCPGGMECLHDDGDRTNNRLDNIAWGTPISNAADRERHGNTARGERNGEAKLKLEQVIRIKSLLSQGRMQKRIAAEYGVHKSTVSLIASGKKWSHVT